MRTSRSASSTRPCVPCRTDYAPVFAAVDDPFDETKSYLPKSVKERMRTMLAAGREPKEVAKECGVSVATAFRERALLRR